MKLPLLEFILALAGGIALAALVVRLAVSGLARVYRFFFWYLVADLLQTSEPLFIKYATNRYAIVFFALEGIMVCLYALILFELYSIMFRDLAGLARLAYRYTATALGLSMAIAFLLRTTLPRPRNLVEQAFFFESPIVLSLVIFVFLITSFLCYYPITLHRNAIVYSIGYSVYFLAKACLLFLNNAASSALTHFCSTAAMVVATTCIIFWAVFLNREGERRTIVVGHLWSTAGAQEQVLKRLHELNDSLLRTHGR